MLKTCQPYRLKINACFSISSSRSTELTIYPFSELKLQSNDAVKKSKHTKREILAFSPAKDNVNDTLAGCKMA